MCVYVRVCVCKISYVGIVAFYLLAIIKLSIAKKVVGIFDSMSDDDDFFTPSITIKSVPKTAPPKKELSESDKKALRYSAQLAHITDTHSMPFSGLF